MHYLHATAMLAALFLGLGACNTADPDTMSAIDAVSVPAPAPKPKPLVITIERRAVTITGDGPEGLADALVAAVEKLKRPLCPFRQVTFENAATPDTAPLLRPLPLPAIAELICGAKSFEMTFHWDSHTVDGDLIFANVVVESTLTAQGVFNSDPAWSFNLQLSRDQEAVPAGLGRLVVVAGADTADATWSIRPVADGAEVTESVKDGWVGFLKPGIYAASNGDHFAIRDGFETRFVPGNPAAIFFGGLRFPLDDTVPIYPKIVSRGPKSMDPDSIDSCETPKKVGAPRCGARAGKRRKPLEMNDIVGVRQIVNQVFFHFDGTPDTPASLDILRSRGLSIHILIDFDGTIYQSVDLALSGYHVGEANDQSVGIELNNLAANLVKAPNAPMFRADHPRIDEMQRHPRPKSEVMNFHGEPYQTYGFTEAQYRSTLAVSRLLLRLFPAVEPTYPKGPDGGFLRKKLETYQSFHGFLGHSVTDKNRWDPGPGFDWERLSTAFAFNAKP